MTLREIYTLLEGYARRLPDIRTIIENDVLKLNELRTAEYGVFAITQNSHTGTETQLAFSLNLFYIDRLTNSGDNEVQVQSHAIEMLRQILNFAAEGGLVVGDAQYNTFTDRFQDLCGGAWVMVTLSAPVSDCIDY